jgi:trehalose 6-phosphate synthase/phosphatase
MITPLRDGMNLVAKEYCAAKTDNSGSLILSEFTGAAAELKQAFFVNPFNIEGMADALHAVLHFPEDTKTSRMQAMRSTIEQYDIHYWVRSFLEAFEDVIDHRQPLG